MTNGQGRNQDFLRGKPVGTWEHWAILEEKKGTRSLLPPGRPSLMFETSVSDSIKFFYSKFLFLFPTIVP